MTGQVVAYIRVSSEAQSLARQRRALDESALQIDQVFQEKASGDSRNRPVLDQTLKYLREGDTLVVPSVDRLARSLVDLEGIIKGLVANGVSVQFLKENLAIGPTGSTSDILIRQVIGAVAQFERAIIRERQIEGIQAAKAAGKHLGRKPSLTPQQVEEVRRRVEQGEAKARLASEYGVSRSTVYAALEA